ncbi:MAG: PD-(D/E)XK nuclease family protein [Opitutaceae bacterium]|nr:PD-(D/E)XK nuclease family protein [Opitutaceae bacterium]
MSSPTLHLLAWDTPLIHAAVDHLATAWDRRGPLDLGDMLLVVPTRRAGRRLREALAAHAAAHGHAVFPPRVVQPEQLLSEAINGQPAASPAEALVAWIDVLRAARLAEFDAVFPVEPVDRGFPWAARLAGQLMEVQAVLGENGLRFADVPARAGIFPELRRWQQLAELEHRHETRLAGAGLASVHVARAAAAAVSTPPDGIRRVVVVATPDPMPLVLRRLEALATQLPVEILVHGPSLDLFDASGRPSIEAWSRRPLELPDFDGHVHLHADPSAQASAIVRLAHAHTAAQRQADGLLGIAIADREILAPLHHGLRRAGLASYDPEGTPHRASELYRLLDLLLAYVEEPAFATAASLLRCPTVLAWLEHAADEPIQPGALLESLDALRAKHLPQTSAEARTHALDHRPRPGETPWQPLARALDALDGLRELASGPFPDGAQAALARLHGQRRFLFSEGDDAAVIATAEAWADIARATADAVGRLGRLNARDTWRLALQQLAETRRFDDKPVGALELQGWLELPWEDAPHLIVAGLNDGRVPSAIVGHAFLPEVLRERLGLKTNAARLARDAYLLHALIASRGARGRIDFLLGRTSAAGDPLRPSRLLLLCDDAELPARVAFLFRDIPPEDGAASATAWRRAWRLAPPAPEPITSVSVTAFRDHLACPFRFYLRHKLRMRPVDPGKDELDARDFGNLLHDALEGLFRESSMLRCTDTAKVRDFLVDRLDRRAHALYGARVSVPLLVQLESARQRLAHAARVHAEGVAAGWTIQAVEMDFTCAVGPLTVTGRIDRIDRHDRTGAVRVLDYKTFDSAKLPQTTHVRRAPAPAPDVSPPPDYARFTGPDGKELLWLDLQLPLYRRALAAEYGVAIEVGYFNLPKAATETGINLWAGFDAAWQAAADRCADGVAAAIAAGTFWPPAEALDTVDEFAPLFHQGAEASVAWIANPGIAP